MWKTPAANSPLLAAHEVLYCIFMSVVLIQNYFFKSHIGFSSGPCISWPDNFLSPDVFLIFREIS